MRNAMWVGGGITGMGEIPMLGVREKGIAKVIRDIFRNGEQGFFYDPSDMGTLYQDVTGTIPVNDVKQPAGLVLDKSKGLTYGEELVTDGNFENILVGSLSNDGGSVSTWELNTNAPISGSRDAKLNVTTPAANRPFLAFPSGLKERGAVYEFSFDYKILTGSPRIRLVGMGAVIGTDVPLTGSGKFVAQCVCTGSSNNANAYFGSSSAYSLQIDNVSVRRVLGNHAYQTTSAARPILQDAPSRIVYDGVDDKLITKLPTPLTNATVLRSVPGVGTQVNYNQTLPMLYEDSTNHSGLIAIDRALTRQEQLRLMTELDKKAGATSLETLTFKVFDDNQEGFVYDPNDLSTLFQDSLGSVPVTSIGQPVGLILDKSKGLVLGTNQISRPNSEELPATVIMPDGAHTWTLNTNSPISGTQDSRLVVTTPSSSVSRPSLSFLCSSPLVPDRLYKFSFRYKVNSGVPRVTQMHTGIGATPVTSDKGLLQGSGTFDVFIRWAGANTKNPIVYFSNESVFDLQINDISVREIKGNHAYQTTSASRPILRKNAVTGANYLAFDGVDDYLISSTVSMSLTDKVTVIAGIRCENRAYQGLIHFANKGNTPNSSFYMAVDVNRRLRWNTIGTVSASVMDEGSLVPSVYTAKSDISGKSLSLAVNQTKTSINVDMGTGKFGNYPLYLGARYDRIHTLSGDMYGLVIVGKLTSNDETAAIEKELAKRVGVTLNV